MHAFQINSHINKNGILSVKLPKESAEKDVNVVLVLEFLNQLQESKPKKSVALILMRTLITKKSGKPNDFC